MSKNPAAVALGTLGGRATPLALPTDRLELDDVIEVEPGRCGPIGRWIDARRTRRCRA